MAIIGSASIQIRADDKYFESDVNRAVRKIKNVTIALKADVDLTKASKKIRDLRYRITSKDAVLKIDADVTKAEARLAKLLSKFTDKDLNWEVRANTQGASTALRELHERYANKRIPFTAQGNTAVARAALAAATRPRTVPIHARMDPGSRAALMGAFNTLTGTISAAKIQGVLQGIATNFEGLAVKASIATTAVSALSAALLTTGANVFSVAGDLTQLIGLAAAAPAVFTGVAATVLTGVMAWKGFGDAAKGGAENLKKANEALAKLPPQAQAAALALRGVGEQIQQPTQNAFWEAVGTSLQDMVSAQLPVLIRGFERLGTSFGGMSKEAFDTIKGLVDFNDVFDNIAVGMDKAKAGIKPFIEGIATLTGVGSQRLPMLGKWMGDLGKQFGAFVDKADKNGDILRWIDTGVQRVKELGSIVKSTTGIFNGLTEAARVSGAPGLTELAAGFRNVRDIVNGEPFKSRLILVLEGARAGTDKMAEGFGNLVGFIGDSSAALSIFLTQAGEIVKLGFDSVKALFDGTGLGNGLFQATEGLKDALKTLQPGFEDLGGAMGGLGEIAGEVLRNMAPGLNNLFETVRGVVDGVKDGVIAAMPIFNRFIEGLLNLVQGPIIEFANQIGNVLEAFANMDGVVQTLIMSVGLFLLLKGKFANFFSGIGKSLTDENTNMGRGFGQIRDAARNTANGVHDSFRNLGRRMAIAGALAGQGFRQNLDLVTNGLPGRMAEAGRQIRDGLAAGLNLGNEFDGVGQRFRDLGTRMSDTASTAGRNVRNAFSSLGNAIAPAGSAIRGVADHARNMATTMHANLGPARTAFTNLATHARTSMSGAMSSIGSGVRQAGGGLMELLGGGWGLALGAATAGLGLFVAAQEKAESKVSSLASALEAQAGTFGEAARKMLAADVLDQDATWFDDLFRSGRRNMEEMVRDTGINMDLITSKLSDPKGRDEFVKNFQALRDAAGDGNEVTDEMAASVGMLKENFKGLSETDLNEMVKQIEEGGNTARAAEERVAALAKATGTTTVEAGRLAANMDILRDASSGADEVFGALKENLDINSHRMRTAQDSARDYAEGQFNLTDAIKGIAAANKVAIDSNGRLDASFRATLVNADGSFSTASRGAIDFSKQMSTARDLILESGAAEFARLRATGAELETAQAGAVKVMTGGIGDLRTRLEGLGFDAGTVTKILAGMQLDPSKLIGALRVDTDEAEAKIQRAALMANAFANGNYSVALAASTDQVRDALMKTGEYKKAYEEGGWEAVLDVIDKGGMKVDEFLFKISEAKSEEDVKKILDAEFAGDPAFEAAKKALQNHNMTPAQIKELKGVDKVTPAATAAKGSLVTYDAISMADKYLKGFDEVTTPAGTAKKSLDIFNGTSPTEKYLRAFNEASLPAESAKGAVDTFNSTNPFDKIFKGVDGVSPPMSIAADGIARFNALTPAEKHLLGYDETSPAASAATGALGIFSGTPVSPKALTSSDQTGTGVASAQTTMGSLQPVSRGLFGLNLAGAGLVAAQATLGLLAPVTRGLFGSNQAGPGLGSAQGTLNSLMSVTRALFGSNQAGAGRNSAQGTLNSLVDVTRALFARNETGTGKNAAQGTINSVQNKTADIYARDSTGPGVQSAKLSIGGVIGKTVDIITNFITRGKNENGGIWQGGVRTFADGGFMDQVRQTAVKSYARGGVENHVAQIARGGWPHRVWAEPETGGEAYIPLAKAKRNRSLTILEQVARMFGMGLFKAQKFADGGFSQTRTAVTGSSGSSSSPMGGSATIPAALLNTITRSLLNDNGGLNNVGQSIVNGIISGVNANRPAAVAVMKGLSQDLENVVRTELDIHSPSKAFLALGKYIVDGLSVGISSNAGTAIKNMATLSNRLYVAASDVKKATGRNVNSSINLINSQKKLNASWSKMPAWKYTDQIVDYYQKKGKTGNRTLADIVRARDDINSRLASANAKLKNTSAARAEVVKNISSQMMGEYKLGTNILSDTTSYVPEVKFADVKTYTTGVLSRLRSFNTKLQNLRKKGVAPALINEIAQLGSAEGSAMADAILEGSSAQIKGLNSDVAAISSVSTAIGNSTADGMYKAGVDATRGLVNGLTKDKNSLTQAATRITNTLVGTVKKNLGIRSPSRVLAEVGKFTTQGYIVGLDAMQPELNRRVDSLVNIMPRNTSVGYSFEGSTTTTAGAATTSAATAAPVVVQVLPSAGMDEEAVGKAAARELNWQYLSR